MNRIFIAVLMTLATITTTHAHDDHGPKRHDAPKYGGRVAIAVSKDSREHLYKGELTRTQSDTVRLYLYDDHMNPLSLDGFENKATATLSFKKQKAKLNTVFSLQKEGKAFVGKMPQISQKPFTIEVHIKEGPREWVIRFPNLDH